MKTAIALEIYKVEHLTTLSSFYLPENQKQFTGLPNEVLNITLEDHNRYPIVITHNGTPVGFFVLHRGEEIHSFSTNPSAMLLRAFSINHKEQGKGFAKEAMNYLPTFVKHYFPDIKEIVLAVNEKNEAAYKLYLKVGFEDRGIRRVGSIGPQYILHYDIT